MPATRAYYYRRLRNESRHQRNSPLGYRLPLGTGGKGGCQDDRGDAVHGCLQVC
jgi:hypothetical protein